MGNDMGNHKDNSKLFDMMVKFSVAVLLLITSYHWQSITELNSRVYDLQRNSVSSESVLMLENRVTKQIDSLRDDVNYKLDLLIKLQERKEH